MKIYSHYGYNDFIICLGYKGYMIKEYFADYFLHTLDVTFDLAKNKMEVHRNYAEPWKVTLIDTGLNTKTGSRLKKVQPEARFGILDFEGDRIKAFREKSSDDTGRINGGKAAAHLVNMGKVTGWSYDRRKTYERDKIYG